MPDFETLLTRWQAAGVLDAETAARIRDHEAQSAGERLPVSGGRASPRSFSAPSCWPAAWCFLSRPTGTSSAPARVTRSSSPWSPSSTSPAAWRGPASAALSTALHAVGTVATGAAIALVGQIFNIQEHWPAAVLLWALAALFGWLLLHDQAQQTLALLLVPAWIFCELGFRTDGYIGDGIYMGRLCFVWAILYITFFVGSRRKAVQGILFAVARDRRGGWHRAHAFELGLVVRRAELHSLRHARLGLDRNRRHPARHRRIPRPQGPRSHCRRHCLLPRAALVLSHVDGNAITAQMVRRSPMFAPVPTCWPTRWWPRLRSPLLVGRAAGVAPLVNLGIVGFAAAVAGSTSATS